jgi:recombination protein RecA
VGDKSSGKTLLGIEACANFSVVFPKGKIFYREAEAAFDESYAKGLGLPVKQVDFGPEGIDTQWNTIEDVFEDLNARIAECKKAKVPGLYIIDSLDALSSRAELNRKPGTPTFGGEKNKVVGELFRVLVREIESSDMAFLIISQVRENIGVAFGEKYRRAGAKSLDFYATHALWLAHLGRLSAEVGKVKRVTGVRIRAQCKKNKLSLPFRECEFDLQFGFGIKNDEASVEWLEEVKALSTLSLKKEDVGKYLEALDKMAVSERKAEQARIREAVLATWAEIEGRFAPTRKKYE